MVIRNLTPKVQSLRVEEYVGGREFTIYVEGNSTTDIEGMFILANQKIQGIFEVEGCDSFHTIPEAVENIPNDVEETILPGDDEPTTSSGEEEVITPNDVEESSESFICDVCGAEFASVRGLTTHKNRSHSE